MNKIYDQKVLEAVKTGLFKKSKSLPSWLYYDQEGDRLFQCIMRMPEYYLTACELDIFEQQKEQIIQHIVVDDDPFSLVELGAGDATKTEILLRHLVDQKRHFTYVPIDVSENVLNQITDRMGNTLPDLAVHPRNALYKQALEELYSSDKKRKVIFFLGSSIGNFSVEESVHFFDMLVTNMHAKDILLMSFDLKKDPRLIQAAYDDRGGITKKFNLNILTRLNRELGAQFDLNHFAHYPFYDPTSGTTKSYLISREEQDIFVEAFNESLHFDKWEPIHTEVSQKYDLSMITDLASRSGLEVSHVFYDTRGYICNVVMKFQNPTIPNG